MKILVTGAAGFIGANLSEKLLKEGNEVFGIDNFITGSEENALYLRTFPKFRFLFADITKLEENLINELKAEKFDEIYHLACPTGVPNLIKLAEEMILTCSLGSRNILEIAKENNSKFLFTSSSEIYGQPEIFPQAETYSGNVHPSGLRSPYEEGKRFSEALTIMYSRKYGLPTRIVRVFNTYGPRMNFTDERVIPKFLSQLTKGEALSVHGEGKQRRTFCYVDDLVEGLIIAMQKGKDGETYNLGSEEKTTILELAELISKITKKELKINFIPRPVHDHEDRLPDLSKIKSLGWTAKTDLKRGLQLTLQLQEAAKI